MRLNISICTRALIASLLVAGMCSVACAEEAPSASIPKPAEPASATPPTHRWVAPTKWMLYSVPAIVFLGAIVGIASVRKALPLTWSLADALSEEVAITPATKTTTSHDTLGKPVIVVELMLDKDGKPILLPEMRASSSRVIALMGMIAIMLMYIGFGTFALYSFGVRGKLSDELNGVVTYLMSGMTLFAPYVVNKFASLFQGLTGAK